MKLIGIFLLLVSFQGKAADISAALELIFHSAIESDGVVSCSGSYQPKPPDRCVRITGQTVTLTPDGIPAYPEDLTQQQIAEITANTQAVKLPVLACALQINDMPLSLFVKCFSRPRGPYNALVRVTKWGPDRWDLYYATPEKYFLSITCGGDYHYLDVVGYPNGWCIKNEPVEIDYSIQNSPVNRCLKPFTINARTAEDHIFCSLGDIKWSHVFKIVDFVDLSATQRNYLIELQEFRF